MVLDQNHYEKSVNRRIEQILAAIVDSGRINIWNVHAFLAQDSAPVEEVEQSVERHLTATRFSFDQSVAGGPFHVLPAMLLLCRWEAELSERTISIIKHFFFSGVIDRGNTENHWLMHYAGSLLAAERWAAEPVMWNGLSPAAVRAEATRWILGMIDRSVMVGHHEYDSTGYVAEHIAPLIALSEFAADRTVREKARTMVDLHFADMALEYFHGAWAGGHAREGYRVNTWTQSGPVRGIHYAYFGSEEFDPASHIQSFITPALTMKYRPKALIVSMAFDRETPFVVRKTKAPRTINRHVDREAGPIRKYTYLSKSFALGSTQLNLPGPPAGPIDLTSWDLSWNAPKHQAKIVCNHPYRDPGRFSAFLSILPQAAERGIGMPKPYLQWPDRLFGASPYERIMQHEGAAIILYQIPPNDRDPYINLYLPKEIGWVERNGWLCADVQNSLHETDGFFLAIYPIGPYRWQEIREATASNIMVRDGDLIDGWLLRIEDTAPGVVVEAVEKRGEFNEFIEKRTVQTPDTREWPGNDRILYTTYDGDRLDMCFDGPHRVNGTEIDYSKWPLFDAPWMQGELGTGVVRFEKDGEVLELDFGVKDPLIPMRVIG